MGLTVSVSTSSQTWEANQKLFERLRVFPLLSEDNSLFILGKVERCGFEPQRTTLEVGMLPSPVSYILGLFTLSLLMRTVTVLRRPLLWKKIRLEIGLVMGSGLEPPFLSRMLRFCIGKYPIWPLN